MPHISEGKLHALAVATRSPMLPDVPTMADAGYREIGKAEWIGVFAPRGTPNDIVAMLSRSVAAIVARSDMSERMATLGFEPVASTPEEFRALIPVELESWGKMIRAANIK